MVQVSRYVNDPHNFVSASCFRNAGLITYRKRTRRPRLSLASVLGICIVGESVHLSLHAQPALNRTCSKKGETCLRAERYQISNINRYFFVTGNKYDCDVAKNV